MKLAFPGINNVFDTEIELVNSIVIENQSLFYYFIEDINAQINGFEGKAVVSDDNKILSPNKSTELLTQFIPFEINKKSHLNKIISELEKKAISNEFYAQTVDLMGRFEKLLTDISFDLSCDLNYTKIDIGALIKSAGVEINPDYTCLAEKIIDYFELVTEFETVKLFVTVNLRSFISDNEASEFMKTALSHEFNLIMIESSEHSLLPYEKRYIIDADLCEIE